MEGSTMSRNCCKDEAPARRAVSRWEGGTVFNAPPKSSIEKAVPRHVLKKMIERRGQLKSQGMLAFPNATLSVPLCVSRKAIHRKATTELGMIQAVMTSTSRALRAGPCQRRNVQASAKPSPICPMTADPSTYRTVTHSEFANAGSPSADVKLSSPITCGYAAWI